MCLLAKEQSLKHGLRLQAQRKDTSQGCQQQDIDGRVSDKAIRLPRVVKTQASQRKVLQDGDTDGDGNRLRGQAGSSWAKACAGDDAGEGAPDFFRQPARRPGGKADAKKTQKMNQKRKKNQPTRPQNGNRK